MVSQYLLLRIVAKNLSHKESKVKTQHALNTLSRLISKIDQQEKVFDNYSLIKIIRKEEWRTGCNKKKEFSLHHHYLFKHSSDGNKGSDHQG